MGPSKKVSTKGKGTQSTISNAKTTQFSVEIMAEKSKAIVGPSLIEVLANEDGFHFILFKSSTRGYCENVVRHFYANADLVEPYAKYLKTFINGVAFVVDDNLFFRLYRIPTGGEFYNGTFNRLEACRVIFKNEAMTQPSKDVFLLDRDMLLLHFIIIHVLKPQAGKLSSLTIEDT
ncbi:hypothetical protein Adt_23468 [Abeliophyllum distichum]|uniref:Uncharacterized protein n=1 Tax=Abeliophyllum distichum TaxID=126358 RepID=A0ABD1SDR1_9LAMI